MNPTTFFIVISIFLFNIIALKIPVVLRRVTIGQYSENIYHFFFSKRYYFILSILIVLFSVYAYYDTDYYHYETIYNLVRGDYLYQSHVEPIYIWFINHSFNSYSFFRFIVWGGALLLFGVLFRRIKQDNDLTLSLFTLFFLLMFAYTRASLGIAVFYVGVSFIVNPLKNKLINIFLIVLFLIGSCLFHKSMILLLAILPFTLLKLTTRKILIFALIYPLGILFINYLLKHLIVLLPYLNDTMYTDTMQDYISAMSVYNGIGAYLLNLLTRVPLYFVFFYLVYKINFKKIYLQLPPIILYFYKILFFVFYTASIVYFINLGHKVLFYRILAMGCIPLIIVLGYLIQKGLINKQLYYSLFIVVWVSCNCRVFYSLYLSLMNSLY